MIHEEKLCILWNHSSTCFEFRIPWHRVTRDGMMPIHRPCRRARDSFCATGRTRISFRTPERKREFDEAAQLNFSGSSNPIAGDFRAPACKCLERPNRLSPRPRNFDPRRGSLYCRRRSRHVEDDAHTHASARAPGFTLPQPARSSMHPRADVHTSMHAIMHIATRASL
jgi:hypothetical protein